MIRQADKQTSIGCSSRPLAKARLRNGFLRVLKSGKFRRFVSSRVNCDGEWKDTFHLGTVCEVHRVR